MIKDAYTENKIPRRRARTDEGLEDAPRRERPGGDARPAVDLDAILDQVAIADDHLLRMEATMSKNQISEHLGISKATLYEWRKQEQIE